MPSRWGLVQFFVVLVCLWQLGESQLGPRRDTAGVSSRLRRPPPTAAVAVGVRGYRRFHANHSLVGRPVPCTADEKLCLRHNLVFHPPSSKCYSLDRSSPQPCDLGIDRAKFETGSHHIVGVCLTGRRDDCAGYRMAFDGKCYRENLVHDVICGCPDPLKRHPLGGGLECHCSPHQPAPRVTQPEENGRCVIPELRVPYAHDQALIAIYPVGGDVPLRCSNHHCYVAPTLPRSQCSGDQRRCFEKGMVWVGARKRCFSLLERGPCENNYLLVLSKNESLGHLTFCRHVRGDCPPGKVRMAFDQRCHDERVINMIALAGLKRNAFGDYMIPVLHKVYYKPIIHRNDCAIRVDTVPIITGRVNGLPRPPCGANNIGDCVVEVYADPPMPLDDF